MTAICLVERHSKCRIEVISGSIRLFYLWHGHGVALEGVDALGRALNIMKKLVHVHQTGLLYNQVL